MGDDMDCLKENAASKLRNAVIDAMFQKDGRVPRNLHTGVLDALEPLILAIAELQTEQRVGALKRNAYSPDSLEPIEHSIPGCTPA